MPENTHGGGSGQGQIEQVLLNLYVNAWQAMPPDGGQLFLETRSVTLDDPTCKPYQTEPGCYVKVSVTDTGIGMDEATRVRIFDRFSRPRKKAAEPAWGWLQHMGLSRIMAA